MSLQARAYPTGHRAKPGDPRGVQSGLTSWVWLFGGRKSGQAVWGASVALAVDPGVLLRDAMAPVGVEVAVGDRAPRRRGSEEPPVRSVKIVLF